MQKTKYQFSHRTDDGLFYIWESTQPVAVNDSRHEIISTPVVPFWATANDLTEASA